MDEPLEIDRVITDEILQNRRNRSSLDTGTYSVPIRLSRTPSAVEKQLLEAGWEARKHNMYRRARVSGYRFTIENTTIEEVGEYHASILREVVDEVNQEAPKVEAQRQADRERREQADADERERIETIADEIDFD